MSFIEKRVFFSLVIYVLWVAITMFGARLIAGGEITLDELVSRGVGWHFAIAIALLFFAIILFKWNDLGFTKPHSLGRVLWFPSIYLLLFTCGVAFLGLPPLGFVIFVVLNTLMVSVSEEVMFRGILFRAFDRAMPIWPAIILTSLLFGAVHVFNVFITGELTLAILQSIAAAMSGFIFLAIVIRTESIWPAIIYHFLWDCLIFLATSAAKAASTEVATVNPEGIALYAPIALNLPNFICALILLRNVGKENGDLQPILNS